MEPSVKRMRRVGHKGAAHIEPGNTLASFDAALRHGVDMIELDVISERPDGSGRLLVAHDYEDMRSRVPLSFDEALEHLAADEFSGIEFDVDVKLPGYELRVLEAPARARPRATDAHQRDVPLRAGADSGRRACAAARLVGTARAPRLHDRHAHRDPRAGDAHRLSRHAAAPRASGARRRPLRRDHGALAGGHESPSSAPSARAAASSMYGPSTTRG